MDEPQAGQIISPQGKGEDKPNTTDVPAAEQNKQAATPVVADPLSTPSESAPPASNWQFTADQNTNPDNNNGQASYLDQSASDTEPVTWSASEFIVHHKSIGWYLALAAAAIVAAALVLIVTHDKVSVVVIIVAAIAFAAFAGRQPRTLQYRLDGKGLSIGNKFYGYDVFRSFSVVEEGAFSSIMLMPLKRFMPVLSLYYAPNDEQNILTVISKHLPLENTRRDIVDSFMHRIHF